MRASDAAEGSSVKTLLRVSGLGKRYPGFELEDVSFSIGAGTITGFIGRNGAGKSTTLKCLEGAVRPDGGTIEYFGKPFAGNERAAKLQVGFGLGEADYYRTKRLSAIAQGQDLVGMPANLFLVGFGLAIFGVFNAFFYPLYYRNPMKVGVPFMVACLPAAVVLVGLEALPYLPFEWCAAFSALGFADLGTQVGGLTVGAVAFAVGSLIAVRLAERSFSTYDA